MRIGLVLIFFFIIFALIAQEPFITTWQTDNPGTSQDHMITIPGDGTYNIYWEEVGNPANNGSGAGGGYFQISFPYPGTYRVEINGNLRRVSFNNGFDRLKIISIDQWGDIEWTSMENAFRGCQNLEYHATDIPDLSGVSTTSRMFEDCISMNGNLNEWDVSSVEDMSSMFQNASSFNGRVDEWDVSEVDNMESMLNRATSFNQPLENWDVSSVNNMDRMFRRASSFNQPLENWDVSSVNNMRWMFDGASSFNQPLENWDVSSVKDMSGMFGGGASSSFNQPLGNWDVSLVENMSTMFTWADSFDQNLGDWELNPNVNLIGLFTNSGMSCESYDATLIGWYNNPITPDGRHLGAWMIEYDHSEAARDSLIHVKGWTFEGDMKGSCDPVGCNPPPPIIEMVGGGLICPGDSTVLIADIQEAVYRWYKDGELLSGEINQQLTVSQAGSYTVSYTDEEDCVSELSEAVLIEMPDEILAMTNARDTILRSAVPNCDGFALFDAAILACDGDFTEIRKHSLWRLDIYNTGQFDIISTKPRPNGSLRNNLRIQEELPFGTHRVQWEIRDEHGNLVIEEHLITLVDMNPPTPVCLHGIAASIHPSSSEITLPAWVYDVGSWDDCTDSEDLIFTYSNDLSDTHHSWNCDDLDGERERTIEIEIWVTNKYGHQNHCVTYIKVQDNREVCANSSILGPLVNGSDSNVFKPDELPNSEDNPEATAFLLHHNYPNPFINTTTIGFELPETGPVHLSIYNSYGGKLYHQSKVFPEGENKWKIETSDLPNSGFYLYRLGFKGEFHPGRMMKMKN
nr:BspA family leucine-rich repeat surface protein [Saprospiraceae bacterium]